MRKPKVENKYNLKPSDITQETLLQYINQLLDEGILTIGKI